MGEGNLFFLRFRTFPGTRREASNLRLDGPLDVVPGCATSWAAAASTGNLGHVIGLNAKLKILRDWGHGKMYDTRFIDPTG